MLNSGEPTALRQNDQVMDMSNASSPQLGNNRPGLAGTDIQKIEKVLKEFKSDCGVILANSMGGLIHETRHPPSRKVFVDSAGTTIHSTELKPSAQIYPRWGEHGDRPLKYLSQGVSNVKGACSAQDLEGFAPPRQADWLRELARKDGDAAAKTKEDELAAD